MKKIIALLAAVALLSQGCGILGNTGTKTTNYRPDGSVESVQEDVALGDKTTSYMDTVKAVSRAGVEKTASRVSGILAATAIRPTDSETTAALKGALAASNIALTACADQTKAEIEAIHYGIDGYDVANSFVGQVPFVTFGATLWRVSADWAARAGNVTFGDKAQVADSFNHTEQHVIGRDQSPTQTGTSPPTIVEPSYPPEYLVAPPETAPAAGGGK